MPSIPGSKDTALKISIRRLDDSEVMEAKLAEYRERKDKQRHSWALKNLFNNSSTFNEPDVKGLDQKADSEVQSQLRQSPSSAVHRNPQCVSETSKKTLVDYASNGLKVALWLCLWKFFIEIGFGAVYFIVGCSYVMYRNTRTGPREGGALSAYSVFNPNQERIDGTFTAEQFEKELRLGSGSVR